MHACRFKRPLISGAAILLFCVPGLTSQALSSTPRNLPNTAGQSPAAQKVRAIEDELVGVKLTEDQKSKMAQIHRDYQAKIDIVSKDPGTDSDQKAAMIDGYHRLERRDIFQVLTPDQLAVVRKNILAERAANQPKARPRRQSTTDQVGTSPNDQHATRPE